MTTAQPFQGNFQSNVSRICFHFFIFQHCCQVFTACTTDIQFSFFFRIQIQQNITVYRSRLQTERTEHTGFFVGSNQCFQRTMFQRLVFHDSHDSGNTHTIIGSQSRAFSFHPISVNVSLDRIIFKIMHCIVILLRNHVHVSLKNHLLTVFHPRSGRLAVNDITGFVLEWLYAYTFSKVQQELLHFLQVTRRAGNLSQWIEMLPHILRSERENCTHNFLVLFVNGKAANPYIPNKINKKVCIKNRNKRKKHRIEGNRKSRYRRYKEWTEASALHDAKTVHRPIHYGECLSP